MGKAKKGKGAGNGVRNDVRPNGKAWKKSTAARLAGGKGK
jgi:hypothetical protein